VAFSFLFLETAHLLSPISTVQKMKKGRKNGKNEKKKDKKIPNKNDQKKIF